MALDAWRCQMGSDQGKGRPGVIERTSPRHIVHPMAARAIDAESCLAMIGRCRAIIVRSMAAETIGADSHVLVFLFIGMALPAVGKCVRTDQGKPGLCMALDHIRHQPRIRGMTPVAGRAEFPPMLIFMAVHASLSGNGKLERRMTRHALHRCMLPMKREAGFLMLEPGGRDHLRPGVCGVALFARKGKRSVRRRLGHTVRSHERHQSQRHQQASDELRPTFPLPDAHGDHLPFPSILPSACG
jgi:hypothetical protein